MMSPIDQIVSSLEEYIENKRNAAKKRFAKALNQYIDYRIDAMLEDRKKRISSEKAIKVEDILTSNIEEESQAIQALNTAPRPLEDISEAKVMRWIKAYKEWYEGPRKDGLNKETD